MIPILAIAGTHGWDGSSAGQWYDPETSPLTAYWRANGFCPRLGADGAGFVWSTELDGFVFGKRLRTWKCGGENLKDWCIPPVAPDRQIPGCELHAVVHSHGLQPTLIACGLGLRINVLVSFGSPARADVWDLYGEVARQNIGFWVHVHSDRTDRWQILGEWFDGHWGIVRRQARADLNWNIPKVGHASLLTDPRLYPRLWPQVFDIIKERHGRPDYLTYRR